MGVAWPFAPQSSRHAGESWRIPLAWFLHKRGDRRIRGEGEGAMGKNPPMFYIRFAYLNMQSAEWANLPGHVRETFSRGGGAWNLHNLPRNLISLCSERFCWSWPQRKEDRESLFTWKSFWTTYTGPSFSTVPFRGENQSWNFKQSMRARNRVGRGLSYRPVRLQRLAKLIPWNRILRSLKV